MFNINTKLIAHRGYSALATENTINAFLLAAKNPFYGIECDVHITKDNEFIVFHDNDTKRLSDVEYLIKDLTLKEILDLNLIDINTKQISDQIKIPLLKDYLKICMEYNKVAVIELKNEYSKASIKKFIEYIKSFKYSDNIILISFNLDNLIKVRKYAPNLKIQYLRSKYDESLIEICKKYHFDINLNHTAISNDVVKSFHHNNILVNVWTVNGLEKINEIASFNVDFITTDGK